MRVNAQMHNLDKQKTTPAWITQRENFKDFLGKQMEDIVMYMNMITEEDLVKKEVELPSKEKMVLGTAIINAPIKWLAAYRYQLFTYLKMNGRPDISTKEAWTVMS